MAQQQALSPTQLAWVREPLSELLKQVRLALEFQDDDAGNANFDGAQQHLGQLSATLRMLGIEGAAQAIEEMHELAGDLAGGRVDDPEREALGTLLGGTVVVDDYLDRLQIGQSDLPLVLLPLVNDIRAARGKPLLPEGAFFKPELIDDLPPIPLFADRIEERDISRLRQLYQTALRNWLRLEKNETPLRRLMVICDALAASAAEIPEQRLWRVSVVAIHGFLAGHVHAGIGIKRLLVRLDLHLRRLMDANANRQDTIDESNLLTRSLLFYLAMAEPGNAAVQAVADHFNLVDILPDRTVLDQAWGSVRGRNREVFESVAKGVLDELLSVKDVLDLQMRAPAIDPEAISPLGETLSNAANTLEMLNVGSAAELVRGESQRLNQLVQSPDAMDQEDLIDVATSLLQVEAHIQRAADAMGEVEREQPINQGGLGGHEFSKVVGTLLSHTLDNLHLAQQQLEQWLIGAADAATGQSIQRLLEESSGAVQMLDQNHVSQLLLQSANYLRERLLDAADKPNAEDITTYADALAALEIYLTSLRDKQGVRTDLLQRATDKLAQLGYKADPNAPPPVATPKPQPVPQPKPAPAVAPAPEPVAETPPAPKPAAPEPPVQPPPAQPQVAAPEVQPAPEPVSQVPQEAQATEESTDELGGIDFSDLSLSSDFDLADSSSEETPVIEADVGDSLQLADSESDWSPSELTLEEPAAPSVEIEASVETETVQLGESDDFNLDGLVEAAELLAPEAAEPAQDESATAADSATEEAAVTPAAEAVPVPDIDPEFLEIFLEEFETENEDLSKALPRLKENPYDRDLLGDIRRSFHTLKGSGRMVGAMEIGEFAWEIENMLNRVIDGHLSMTDALPVVGDAISLLPAMRDRLTGQGLEQTATTANTIAQAAIALCDPKRAQAEAEPVEEPAPEITHDEADTEAAAGIVEESVVPPAPSVPEPVEPVAEAEAPAPTVSEDVNDFTMIDMDFGEDAGLPPLPTEQAEPATTASTDDSFVEFSFDEEDAITEEPNIVDAIQDASAEQEASLPLDEFNLVDESDDLSSALEAFEAETDVAATETQEDVADFSAADDSSEMLVEIAEETAEPVVAEAEDKDEITETAQPELVQPEPVQPETVEVEAVSVEEEMDPTLAELIRAELAEHRSTIQKYLEDSDYRGWAEVPSDILVRAIHTIAGNLGLANRPGDTEALHTVERYLRELGTMRKPPEAEGLQLLKDTVRLTTQRLLSLSNEPLPGNDPPIDVGQLTQQAKTLLDQLYKRLEAELAEQSDAVKAPVEEALNAARDAVEEAPVGPVSTETVEEVDLSAETFDDIQISDADAKAEEPELADFDLEPFAAFDQVSEVAADDPWADVFTEEASAESQKSTGDDWLSGDDFAALVSTDETVEEETPSIDVSDDISTTVESQESDLTVTELEQLGDIETIDLGELEAADEIVTPMPDTLAEEETIDLTPEVSVEESVTDVTPETITVDEFAEVQVEEEEALSLHEVEPLQELDLEPEVSEEVTSSSVEADLETTENWLAEETAEEIEMAPAPVVEEIAPPEPLPSESEPVAEMPAVAEAPAAPEPAAPAEPMLIRVNYADLDPDLLDIFLEESEEILEGMDNALQEWRDEKQAGSLNELKRQLHTLKGGARMAGLDAIGELGHELETMLELSAPKGYAGADMETIQFGCDELHGMLEAAYKRDSIPASKLLAAGSVPAALEMAEAAAPAAEPEAAAAEAEIAASPEAAAVVAEAEPEHKPSATEIAAAEGRTASSDVVRVNALLLDSLVNYAGEISIFRSRLEQELGSIRTHVAEVEETVQRLRDQLRKLELETEAQILSRFQREQDEAGQEFDPLELDRYSTIQQLSRALAESVNDLISLQEVLEASSSQSETLLLQQSRVNTELQEGLMQTRLVPFLSLAPRLRRVVRRAAGEAGRKAHIDIDIKGGEGLLDRNVLDRITAPLEHMLRNSIVHGIETPVDRRGRGKPEEGTITITIDREATELLIQVADDGRGINAEKILKRAVDTGLTTAQAQHTINEVLNFIFSPGFSTASELTELAGRGVGMDVVSNEVRQLGGSIDIATELGKGTRFDIRIPLSLAVMQAIMVRAGERSYAIPLTSVRGVAKMTVKDYLQAVDSTHPVFEYGGREYPILELEPQLGLEALGVPEVSVPLLMIEAGDARAALRVAELQNHREIVVKPVGPQISSIPGILGGTITGDGQVVVILDMGPLIRRGLSESRLPGVQLEYMSEALQEQKRTPLILVVDDSITMRKVTSRVLENRKLEVMTARDGLDAVEVMYDRIPDLILLDIEMPRMDGYELATHVRNDPRLRHLPMMIISSRTGEKHRQRGDEVGVNRYLGKPYREPELIKNVFELLEMDPPVD